MTASSADDATADLTRGGNRFLTPVGAPCADNDIFGLRTPQQIKEEAAE